MKAGTLFITVYMVANPSNAVQLFEMKVRWQLECGQLKSACLQRSDTQAKVTNCAWDPHGLSTFLTSSSDSVDLWDLRVLMGQDKLRGQDVRNRSMAWRPILRLQHDGAAISPLWHPVLPHILAGVSRTKVRWHSFVGSVNLPPLPLPHAGPDMPQPGHTIPPTDERCLLAMLASSIHSTSTPSNLTNYAC